jgi:RNA polymerase sigma factor (sigma-70 family)
MDIKTDDSMLISEALKGNQNAYTILMHKYKQAIFGVAFKIVKQKEDAEDIVSETFSKAFKHLNTYTKQFAFSTWLFKIASNTAIDKIRKKNIPQISINDDNSLKNYNQISTESNAEIEMIKKQEKKQVQLYLNKLDENSREILRLRYFEELSYDEIASGLNISLTNVKVQLHRAKKQMRKIISTKKKK